MEMFNQKQAISKKSRALFRTVAEENEIKPNPGFRGVLEGEFF